MDRQTGVPVCCVLLSVSLHWVCSSTGDVTVTQHNHVTERKRPIGKQDDRGWLPPVTSLGHAPIAAAANQRTEGS